MTASEKYTMGMQKLQAQVEALKHKLDSALAQLQCAREATEVYAKWWRNAYALRISRTQRRVLEAMGSASDEELAYFANGMFDVIDGIKDGRWLSRVAKAELFRRQS